MFLKDGEVTLTLKLILNADRDRNISSIFFIDDNCTRASLDTPGTFDGHDGVGVRPGSNPVPQKLQNGWLDDAQLPLKLTSGGGHQPQLDGTYSRGLNNPGDNPGN